MSELVINELPGKTFRWLGVNGTKINTTVAAYFPETLREQAETYVIPAHTKREEPIRISFAYDRPVSKVLQIRAERGSQGRVILDCSAAATDAVDAADGLLCVQIQLEDDAQLEWIQLQTISRGARLVNRLQITCADNARLLTKQIYLGEGAMYQDLQCALAGYQSALQAEAAYMIAGSGRLDVNYVATHTGRKSASNIRLNGVLRDTAEKIFRGTIDFQNGAVGAEGEERENVLLMDPTVSNKTVPLILCAEEHVSGNHGATIGKLGKELLFYMESRGLSREEVYEMMARANVDALVEQIADEQIKELVGVYHCANGRKKTTRP